VARFISIYTIEVFNSVVKIATVEKVWPSREYHIILVEQHRISILRETKALFRLRNDVLTTNQEKEKDQQLEN